MGTQVNRSSTKICVIESRWEDQKNTSVRGMFDLLSDLKTGSNHGYQYEMANSKDAFKEIVLRVCEDDQINYISFNMHGSSKSLEFYNGEKINKTEFRDLFLENDLNNRNKCGLHFGSCSFFKTQIAKYMYEKDISPWWIAGYGKDIDWIESTALDMLFFAKLLKFDGAMRRNPKKAIEMVAEEMNEHVRGLVDQLGFQIWVCDVNKKPDRVL